MRFGKRFTQALALTLLLVSIGFYGYSQSEKPSKVEKQLYKQAYNKLDMEQYPAAIEDYKQLLEMRPNDPQYNFEIGIAYLRSPKEFYLAEEHFQRSLKYSTEDTIEELYYYLGKSLQSNHKFEEAKESYANFERFIDASTEGQKLKAQVDWLQKTCNHGEYHVKLNTKNPLENKSKPVDDIKKYFLNATDYVILQNLGNKINTVHDDEGAVLFDDETFLLYTSERNPFADPNELSYEKEFEQVYVSNKDGEEWGAPDLLSAKKIFDGGFLDPASHIAITSSNKAEDHIFFYKDEALYESKKMGGKWTNPKALPGHINLKKSVESSACVSEDGKTLVVISDKEGGYGGRDMYMCKLDENGNWGDMVNMGSVLNTEQDEDTPFMVGDDLLYFSSKGHSSIGGYDIFYSKYENGAWSNPQSLGIPINTPQDEISYVRSKKDPLDAYYASSRIDGYGYLDIYKITTFYRTKKRDDLPALAMSDFLSDNLKYTEKEKEQQAVEQDQSALNPVVAAPIVPVGGGKDSSATDDAIAQVEEPVKEEPVKTEPEIKPEPVVAAKPKPKAPVDNDIFRDIRFKFNSDELSDDSEEQVRKIAQYMKENPDYVISLSGHADYLGTEETNLEVSKQRALIVLKKLTDAGANPYNIQYSYAGESDPKVAGKNADGSDNPDGRAQNRRVEFELAQLALYRVITFGMNSSSISGEGNATLKQVADYVAQNPGSKVILSGFSDSVGDADYNRRLSEKRVNNTADKLVGMGVNKTQIQTEFFGEERPSAPGTNSRRVEIKVQ